MDAETLAKRWHKDNNTFCKRLCLQCRRSHTCPPALPPPCLCRASDTWRGASNRLCFFDTRGSSYTHAERTALFIQSRTRDAHPDPPRTQARANDDDSRQLAGLRARDALPHLSSVGRRSRHQHRRRGDFGYRLRPHRRAHDGHAWLYLGRCLPTPWPQQGHVP